MISPETRPVREKNSESFTKVIGSLIGHSSIRFPNEEIDAARRDDFSLTLFKAGCSRSK